MDELEFRRRILAEPSTIDKELEAFAEQDTEKHAFVMYFKPFLFWK